MIVVKSTGIFKLGLENKQTGRQGCRFDANEIFETLSTLIHAHDIKPKVSLK